MQVTKITVIANPELRVDILAPYPFVAAVVSFGFVMLGGQLLQSFGAFVISFFVIGHGKIVNNRGIINDRETEAGHGFRVPRIYLRGQSRCPVRRGVVGLPCLGSRTRR